MSKILLDCIAGNDPLMLPLRFPGRHRWPQN
jgi:hypothetical protein